MNFNRGRLKSSTTGPRNSYSGSASPKQWELSGRTQSVSWYPMTLEELEPPKEEKSSAVQVHGLSAFLFTVSL